MRKMRNTLEETVGGEASERGSRGRERQRRQRQSAIDASARTVRAVSCPAKTRAPLPQVTCQQRANAAGSNTESKCARPTQLEPIRTTIFVCTYLLHNYQLTITNYQCEATDFHAIFGLLLYLLNMS